MTQTGKPGGRALLRRASVTALVLAMASSVAPVAADPYDAEDGLREHEGGFVLQLDTPAVRTRGKCATVSISNAGGSPLRNLHLVARSANLGRAGLRPEYHPLQVVAMPVGRTFDARVCSSQVQPILRAVGERLPIAVEVAVYRISPGEAASGRWAGPADDSARMSHWLRIPSAVWTGKETATGSLAGARGMH